MFDSNSNNRLRSLTRVTTSTINYVLKARLRMCIQRAALCMQNAMLNPNTNSSQIGIWCSGTNKCSQRYEIGHFCKGNISTV